MTNALQVFNYQGNQVRTVEKDGETWFVAKDVCDILGLEQVTNAIKSLDDDEKMTLTNIKGQTGQRGGAQFMNVISEAGVYKLIFKSRKPEAIKFNRWLAHEVLPQIYRTGAYVPDKALMNPEFIRQMSRRLDELQKENEKQRKYIEANMPSTTVGRLYLGHPKAVDAQEASHMFQQQGIDIGMKRFYAHERAKGYLCSRKGRQWNRPTRRAIEEGLYTYQISKSGNFVSMVLPKRLWQAFEEFYQEQYPILHDIEQDETRELLATQRFLN